MPLSTVAQLVALPLLLWQLAFHTSALRSVSEVEGRALFVAQQRSPARHMLDLYSEHRFDEVLTLLREVRDFRSLSSEVTAAATSVSTEVTAAFLLEAANSALAANKRDDGVALIEEACGYARKMPASTAFGHHWEMAALALLQADINLGIKEKSPLEKHLGHSRGRLPPGFEQLSLAIRQEQRAAAFLFSRSPGLGPQVRSVNDAAARSYQRGQQTVEDAYRMMAAAYKFEAVRGEAAVRLTFLSLSTDRTDEVARWSDEALQMAPDAGTRYLIHLFRGRALQATGRAEDARTEYRAAADLVPTQTATIALASAEFLAGAPETADSLMHSLQRAPTIVRDPWSLYFAGAYRDWPVLLASLRMAIQ